MNFLQFNVYYNYLCHNNNNFSIITERINMKILHIYNVNC